MEARKPGRGENKQSRVRMGVYLEFKRNKIRLRRYIAKLFICYE